MQRKADLLTLVGEPSGDLVGELSGDEPLALAVEALWAHCALQTSSQHSKSLTSNQNISPVKFRRAVALEMQLVR